MSGAGWVNYSCRATASGANAQNSGGKKDDLATTLLSSGAGRMLPGSEKALDRLIKEATRQDVAVTVLETETGRYSDTLRSALVSLDGDNAWALSESWCGTIQWICPSPYRPHHRRKTGFWALGVLPLMSRNNPTRSVMRRCVRRGRAVNMSIKPTRRYAPRIWLPELA